MYPLKLNVNPEGWRLFMRRKLDQRFAEFSQKIFRRDQCVCQFCGLTSEIHHEIINLDQNYFNNIAANLVTACNFCAQCFFLESVGTNGYGGGVLIYLPEIPQNYLNGLCHTLFSAINNNTEYKESAQNAYRHLKLRSQIIEDEWGETMHEPALFGQLLVESDDKAILSKKIFSTVRLLPSRAGFKEEHKNGMDASSLQP
ncbi:MAG: type IVB secretion system protein IcmJDotN [Rickettsiella sp.]|nr:type IVB secretion system protein IcmJDotN [Rickettsiella sp.]